MRVSNIPLFVGVFMMFLGIFEAIGMNTIYFGVGGIFLVTVGVVMGEMEEK